MDEDAALAAPLNRNIAVHIWSKRCVIGFSAETLLESLSRVFQSNAWYSKGLVQCWDSRRKKGNVLVTVRLSIFRVGLVPFDSLSGNYSFPSLICVRCEWRVEANNDMCSFSASS